MKTGAVLTARKNRDGRDIDQHLGKSEWLEVFPQGNMADLTITTGIPPHLKSWSEEPSQTHVAVRGLDGRPRPVVTPDGETRPEPHWRSALLVLKSYWDREFAATNTQTL